MEGELRLPFFLLFTYLQSRPVRRVLSSVHSLARMHVLSGLRRLVLEGLRKLRVAGPWVRQSRTFGPGRSALVAKIDTPSGPPLMSAPRACPPAPPAMRFALAESTARSVPPVGARLRAISRRSGYAADYLARVDIAQWAAAWRWHCPVTTQREGFCVYPCARAVGSCAGHGDTASLAYRAQARSHRQRGVGVPACATRNGMCGLGVGQALGVDMSGGPPSAPVFANRALRPGPKVRDWRPQGPDRPRLPQTPSLRRRKPLNTCIRASE